MLTIKQEYQTIRNELLLTEGLHFFTNVEIHIVFFTDKEYIFKQGYKISCKTCFNYTDTIVCSQINEHFEAAKAEFFELIKKGIKYG